MRLLKTLVLGALAYGGYVYLRRLLDQQGPGEAPQPTASSSSSPPASRSSSSNGDGTPSKAELYERAQELDIKGRSKMSKDELERAIRNAG
jgi:hypothetical protein